MADTPTKSRAELHQYWRHSWDGRNDPEQYLRGEPRGRSLVGLIRRYASSDASVLEIGCNVGRNHHHLFEAGFTQLAGVDISEDAVGLLRRTYPAMAAVARLHVRPVEEFLPSLVDDGFDVVFTMAVLERLHEDSASVFVDIARVSKRLLVTVEDEREYAWRQFPRNYRKVFEGLARLAPGP